MKKFLFFILFIAATLIIAGVVFWERIAPRIFSPNGTSGTPGVSVNAFLNSENDGIKEKSEDDIEDIAIIANNLQIPWEMAFLPDGSVLVTERPGNLLRVFPSRESFPVEGAYHIGEGGLLGMTMHPQFSDNNYLYLYLTTRTGEGIENRIERYVFQDNNLRERSVILSGIPGAQYHDGGRMEFGPDGKLYITTGDAGNSNLAQSKESLAGKILRLNDDGSIPSDNPFGNAIYSYGHRNPQGLAWDDEGNLWATEHGRSGVRSGYDELNKIEPGKNYGWPVIQGSEAREGMESPVIHSGANTTWAPAGAVYWDGSVFFAGLRGEALYEVRIEDGSSDIQTHFYREFGRLRAVVLGQDGNFYLATSNTDGRGTVREGDDVIIRINPEIFRN